MNVGRRTVDSGWRAVVAAVVAVGVTAAFAGSRAAAEQAPAVETAVRSEAEATVKAFNAADATTLANGFHEAGELVDEDGNVYRGRAEIAGLFKKFFARFPQAVMEMEVSGVRPIGEVLAVEEGVRRITADAGAAAAQMRYVAVRMKQGVLWPVVSYREFADDPLPTPPEMLAAVEWLVGDWVDESDEGRTTISYRWSEDGNFIIGEYNLTISGKSVGKSTQRIGWDPVESELRSWTFDSDGGFAEGEWAADGAGWIIKSEATMPSGSTGSATVTITPKDKDHFVVESTDRIVGGTPEPDFKLVVARRPPAPAATK